MECSFEEEITFPNGSYQHSKCINRAEILLINDPCYGLCYACAYKKLQAENKRYKEALEYAYCQLQNINTARKALNKFEVNLELLEQALKEKYS